MHIYIRVTYAHIHTCDIYTYTYVLLYQVYIYVYIFIYIHTYVLHIHIYTCITDTGWRRLIGSPTLQIIFHKRAIKYRSLLREMTYTEKGSYGSSPPCTHLPTGWRRLIGSLIFTLCNIM